MEAGGGAVGVGHLDAESGKSVFTILIIIRIISVFYLILVTVTVVQNYKEQKKCILNL